MMHGATYEELLINLRQYKKKYYLNRLVRGSLITIGLVSSIFLAVALTEYYGRFNSIVRLSFLIILLSSIAYTLAYWICIPVIKLFQLDKALTNEEASKQIGAFFPEIKDKLINTLQLQARSNNTDNALILASIQQKSKELNTFSFSGAIDISENRRYARYVLPPIFLIIILLIVIPGLLTESANRIIKYNNQFLIPAPFEFNILNKKLSAYKNQDLEIDLELTGDEIPDQCYILIHNQRYKLKRKNNGVFSYEFKNLQRNENFTFEAAGFLSKEYEVGVSVKPDIRGLDILLQYPAYLKKSSESIKNGGNLSVPEGTIATWNIETIYTDELIMQFESQKNAFLRGEKNENIFRFKKIIRNDDKYSIHINHSKSEQLDPIQYTLTVIKDQYPSIIVEEFRDSTLMEEINFGGSLSDDYGLNRLLIHYSVKGSDKAIIKKGTKPIFIDAGKTNQTFYSTWRIDSIKIEPGQELEYYLEVFDNDGINGSKGTKSPLFSWKIPSKEELDAELKTASSSASSEFQEVADKAKQLQKEMQELEERLKSKKQLSWQDKKAMEEMVKKNKELEKELQKLKEDLKKLQEKQDKFDPASQELAEKMKQLEKLMNELLDEETKKMMEELEKLLHENANKEEIDKALKNLTDKDKFLEKEIERNLELFKQMQFDRALEKNIEKLDELAKKQEDLANKTLEQKTPKEELQKEQEQLNKEFDKLQEDTKSLEEMNKELENKKPLEDLEQEENEIDQQMEKSSEELQNNQSKKAGASQKSAADKMKKMSDKMQQMKQNMEAEQASENMKDLRQILDNLLHVSFDEEALMKEFRKVRQSDPRYITLGQQQLKLKDDSKIIKDSLYALAKRVPQIEAFVTKEVVAMNQYMDAAVQHIKERRPDLAAADQQYAMTSMNNLALMLNEVLKQMQEDMANSQPKMSGAQCNKPKPGSSGKPKNGNISEMQKQLSQRIEELKKNGGSGKGFSEELAKLAAEQERIRKSLQEMEKVMKEQGGNPSNEMKKLSEMMEQTERDLVNKNITNETIMRQREIQTRLLEAEKSIREREWDNTRESKTATQKTNNYPPSLEKYLKAKEKQLELIKTIPPSYTPYYKEEIDDYFKALD
ncbi:DUF4175 family protein [Cytophaga aurantiaca]|uniref:DUF4175 family protein n=1 Tax=Cytophaga aurantiaca TaxID=29530 RepID=UPI00036F94F6|nr:DUF4175 family protein [Cytophaga aurantiaca]